MRLKCLTCSTVAATREADSNLVIFGQHTCSPRVGSRRPDISASPRKHDKLLWSPQPLHLCSAAASLLWAVCEHLERDALLKCGCAVWLSCLNAIVAGPSSSRSFRACPGPRNRSRSAQPELCLQTLSVPEPMAWPSPSTPTGPARQHRSPPYYSTHALSSART